MSNKDLTELATQETTSVATQMSGTPMGFEDEEAGDMIVPRIKIIQTLSPERKEKLADEGDIINSLTKEKLNGKVFVPVFKFNNNIDWKDRSEGGGILCIARDGKMGEKSDGTRIMCASCKRCEFDNTKQGKEAIPKCTKYINFFGFFAGERSPIILSFAKTNYNEGKKLYSLAKVTMQNMWNYGYTLNEKLMAKNSNEWYVITTAPSGATSEEDREFGLMLYKAYRNNLNEVNFDMDEGTSEYSSGPAVDTSATEF
jgi:hypothetical protein